MGPGSVNSRPTGGVKSRIGESKRLTGAELQEKVIKGVF